MRIAICDDEQPILDMIFESVKKEFLAYTDHNNKYECFTDPAECVASSRNGFFDAAFLDIGMTMDGITVAKKLQQDNPNICIIFISSKEGQVFDSFHVGARRFIRKNKLEEELPEAVRFVWEDFVGKSNRIEILVDHERRFLRMDDIYYIESFKNYLLVHLKSEIVKTRRALADIKKDLPENFIRSHKSFIINSEHIKKLSGMSIILSNNGIVPISRQRFDKVQAEIVKRARTWM